jgi:hypothetical protein
LKRNLFHSSLIRREEEGENEMTQEIVMLLVCISTVLGTLGYIFFSKVKGEGEGSPFLKVESSSSSFKSSHVLGKKKEKKKMASFRGEHRRY